MNQLFNELFGQWFSRWFGVGSLMVATTLWGALHCLDEGAEEWRRHRGNAIACHCIGTVLLAGVSFFAFSVERPYGAVILGAALYVAARITRAKKRRARVNGQTVGPA